MPRSRGRFSRFRLTRIARRENHVAVSSFVPEFIPPCRVGHAIISQCLFFRAAIHVKANAPAAKIRLSSPGQRGKSVCTLIWRRTCTRPRCELHYSGDPPFPHRGRLVMQFPRARNYFSFQFLPRTRTTCRYPKTGVYVTESVKLRPARPRG